MLVGMPLLRVFDRMGCGGIILSTTGHVLAITPARGSSCRTCSSWTRLLSRP